MEYYNRNVIKDNIKRYKKYRTYTFHNKPNFIFVNLNNYLPYEIPENMVGICDICLIYHDYIHNNYIKQIKERRIHNYLSLVRQISSWEIMRLLFIGNMDKNSTLYTLPKEIIYIIIEQIKKTHFCVKYHIRKGTISHYKQDRHIIDEEYREIYKQYGECMFPIQHSHHIILLNEIIHYKKRLQGYN